ncbi:exo-beta-N-acetylmuramidase NamZ domain-containing protein [Brevibacillus massiliensis]|uniref:exo-beta-N-acetylmuramidase NamZ domain-containing protein n=1 Tax=Brevibacillus massiliensis TaxID=1118054 RepID=UPI0002D3B210|nr:exo-beta-N-acetylmuramidase NamZ domain-containing protein [Brevibacillus massiliensis]
MRERTSGVKKELLVLIAAMLLVFAAAFETYAVPKVSLGDDLLISKYHHYIDGKNIGIVTNQTGVNSQGASIIDVLFKYPKTKVVALFGPEHGIDGKASAGAYVESYTDSKYKVPVYSLYGKTRMPTEEMLKGLDLLVFDMQDIGARSYTYISTLQYCMQAAKKYGKQIVVLDRPNPLGGTIVDGPVLEDRFISFVGADNLPMAHGMTVGELAYFFNRKIGANLAVVPMEGYTRNTIWQDTGLRWVQSSPNIPDITSVLGYMATGLGEGTGITQADKFKWVGGKGINSQALANLLNNSGLKGVSFTPEQRGSAGGVRPMITDPRTFNPAKTGIYVLGYAHSLNHFAVPKSTGADIVMFDRIMGTDQIGKALEQGLTPQQIEVGYAEALAKFKEERKKYLIYGNVPLGAGNSPAGPALVTAPPSASQAGKPTAQPPKPPQPKPNPNAKVAYLTFDDGPSVNTPKILDILKENQVKATFFVVGRNVKGREAILKREVDEGHVVGGHTFSHDYNLVYKTVDGFFKDLEAGNKAIEQVTGVAPTLIRFPGGSNNTVSKHAQDPGKYGKNQWIMPDIVKEATKRGYRYFDWNVSIGDASAKGYTVESAVQSVVKGTKNAKQVIILMHDGAGKDKTVQALPKIIQTLKAEGYLFEVLGHESYQVSFLK